MKTFFNIAILLLGITSLTLVGCNTVDGVGEDIEAGGEAIQDADE